jgi:hypothetical protein
VHERHLKVVCECNYKWKTDVRGGKQLGVHEVTSNSMGVCFDLACASYSAYQSLMCEHIAICVGLVQHLYMLRGAM